METKRLWVIEYSVLCMKHIKDSNLGSGMIADRLDRLCHNARVLHKQFENACNGELSERQQKIMDNTMLETDKIVSELFPARDMVNHYYTPYADYNHDPRGPPIKLYIENDREIIVPY